MGNPSRPEPGIIRFHVYRLVHAIPKGTLCSTKYPNVADRWQLLLAEFGAPIGLPSQPRLLYVSNTISLARQKFETQMFSVVRMYELGNPIVMKHFGLEEFYDLEDQTSLEKLSRHTKITEFPALVLGYGAIKSMNNLWPARYVTRSSPMVGRSFFCRSW